MLDMAPYTLPCNATARLTLLSSNLGGERDNVPRKGPFKNRDLNQQVTHRCCQQCVAMSTGRTYMWHAAHAQSRPQPSSSYAPSPLPSPGGQARGACAITVCPPPWSPPPVHPAAPGSAGCGPRQRGQRAAPCCAGTRAPRGSAEHHHAHSEKKGLATSGCI